MCSTTYTDSHNANLLVSAKACILKWFPVFVAALLGKNYVGIFLRDLIYVVHFSSLLDGHSLIPLLLHVTNFTKLSFSRDQYRCNDAQYIINWIDQQCHFAFVQVSVLFGGWIKTDAKLLLVFLVWAFPISSYC